MGRKGVPSIELTYSIDVNGMLSVRAVDAASGSSKGIKITNNKGRLSEQEIERMLRDAERFAEADKLTKERIDAREAFENYLDAMATSVEGKTGLATKLTDEEKRIVKDAMSEGRSWLGSNTEANAE